MKASKFWCLPFAHSVHTYSRACKFIISPTRKMLHCFSSCTNSMSLIPTQSAQCRCISTGGIWVKMLTRNHLHYQHPKPAIINREGIITYLFILKIAKRAILKKKKQTRHCPNWSCNPYDLSSWPQQANVSAQRLRFLYLVCLFSR